MTDRLYQAAILRLAREGRGDRRLTAPDAAARIDNPLCGDRVTMEFRLQADGRITETGHRVQGCALCEASAALIRMHAPGLDTEQIGAVRRQLLAYLDDGQNPPPDWPELSAFAPVRDFRTRHECVRLPFDAALKALEQAPGKKEQDG